MLHLQTKFFSVAQYDSQAHTNILQVNIEVTWASSWYKREEIGIPPKGKIIAARSKWTYELELVASLIPSFWDFSG